MSAAARGAHAQQWTADASVGRWLYDTPVSATGASSLTLGVGYDDPARWHRIAGGIPLTEGEPIWGWAGSGAALSTSMGPVRPGVDVTLGGFVYRVPGGEGEEDRAGNAVSPAVVGTGGTVELLPGLTVPLAAARISARAGMAGYYGTEEEFTWSRTGFRSDLRMTLLPVSSVVVAGEGRLIALDGHHHTYSELSGTVIRSAGAIRGTVGRWWSHDGDAEAWSIEGSMGVGPTTELWGSVAREATNPLYQNPPRTNWAVGVTIRLGSTEPASRREAPHVEAGTVAIHLPDGYTAPAIAGDFSDWEPVGMVRSENGWSVELDLAPGVYRYAFRSADGEWFVPEGAPGRMEDGMGGHVAVLVVR